MHRRGFLLGMLGAGRPMKDPLTGTYAVLDQAVTGGSVSAAVLHVQAKSATFVRAFGRERAETVFLLASITSP